MALKSLLLLVALASSAIAQSITPEPSSTMVGVMTSTPTPMETPTPGPLFVNVSAEEIRRAHFFVSIVLQVCLMSQSWDNLASMHDHLYMPTKHRDIVHAQTVSCLGKIVH